jgi:hypothetical protein
MCNELVHNVDEPPVHEVFQTRNLEPVCVVQVLDEFTQYSEKRISCYLVMDLDALLGIVKQVRRSQPVTQAHAC